MIVSDLIKELEKYEGNIEVIVVDTSSKESKDIYSVASGVERTGYSYITKQYTFKKCVHIFLYE
jgi:hypothetical protein